MSNVFTALGPDLVIGMGLRLSWAACLSEYPPVLLPEKKEARPLLCVGGAPEQNQICLLRRGVQKACTICVLCAHPKSSTHVSLLPASLPPSPSLVLPKSLTYSDSEQ